MKKKYFILFISAVIFLLTISITITIFSNSKKDDVEEKLMQELTYLDDKLLGMINALNNITFSNSVLLEQNTVKGQQNNNNNSNSGGEQQSQTSEQQQTGQEQNQNQSQQGSSQNENTWTDYNKYNVENKNILLQSDQPIDWSYMKNCVEILYSTWPTIMIDLHNKNVKNENILSFSTILDNLVVNIEKEDKRATLGNLEELYSHIPIYIEQFSNNSDKINIAYTKACIIKAYTFLEDDNWQIVEEQIGKAGEYFGLIINSINEQRQQNSVSKTYIAINEMGNVINLKDKKLFYLKYINLMENAMQI